jgi:hypothetical protein
MLPSIVAGSSAQHSRTGQKLWFYVEKFVRNITHPTIHTTLSYYSLYLRWSMVCDGSTAAHRPLELGRDDEQLQLSIESNRQSSLRCRDSIRTFRHYDVLCRETIWMFACLERSMIATSLPSTSRHTLRVPLHVYSIHGCMEEPSSNRVQVSAPRGGSQ